MGVREPRPSGTRQPEQLAHALEVVGKTLESTDEVDEARAIGREDERGLRSDVRMVERDRGIDEAREGEAAQVDPLRERARAQIRIAARPCRHEPIEGVAHEGERRPAGPLLCRDTGRAERRAEAHDVEVLQVPHASSDRAEIVAGRPPVEAIAVLDAVVAVHVERTLDA